MHRQLAAAVSTLEGKRIKRKIIQVTKQKTVDAVKNRRANTVLSSYPEPIQQNNVAESSQQKKYDNFMKDARLRKSLQNVPENN